jgi:protease IV
MTIDQPEKNHTTWSFASVSIWILIPLVVGILLSLLIPRPVVGVIYMSDAIYYYSAHEIIQQLTTARDSDNIRAVVLVMNSPGGTVTDTESVYREINTLKQTKPVVTVIEGIAASGGYYVASASNFIYAKASSEIGNIGVIGTQPEKPMVFEDIYSSGPYKIWGMPRDSFSREMEMLKQGFLQAVKLGRGERLKLSNEVILRGEIYSGGDALRHGLVDALGSQSDGIAKAAQLAGIRHYATKDMFEVAGLPMRETLPMGFYSKDSAGNVSAYPAKAGLYMLYIPELGDAQ